MNKKTTPAWPSATPPGIDCACTPAVFRAMRAALRAIDRDIELIGEVTQSSIEKVRAALALDRKQGTSK